MPGEVLQVDDVTAAFASGGQSGDAERMHRHVWIEPEGIDIAADELFDCPGSHRLEAEAIAAHASGGTGGGKERPGRLAHAGDGQPGGEPLDGL